MNTVRPLQEAAEIPRVLLYLREDTIQTRNDGESSCLKQAFATWDFLRMPPHGLTAYYMYCSSTQYDPDATDAIFFYAMSSQEG